MSGNDGSEVTLYRGGRLLTPDGSLASALVVSGGLLRYVGDDAGASAWSSTAAVDLGGRLVTPAFVDAHLHTIQTGQVMAGLDLAGAASREVLLDLVAGFARTHPAARVVFGQGWDERGWPDPRPPTRAELDRAGGGLPVYLARVDVHSAVVSTGLLDEVGGIGAEVGYTDAGLVSRDAHHRCRTVMDSLFSDAERREAARAALTQAASVGIGAVHELGGPHLGPLEDLVRVREVAAEIGMDAVTYWGELAEESSIAKARQVGALGLAGDLCVDGAIGSRTAALVEPYADADTRGARYLSVEEVAEHVVGCTRAGLQAGFHCIGDDAVAATVEGFRRAASVLGESAIRTARHRLEHLEMLAEDDIPTLTELGVVASMQPGFDAAWGSAGELYEQRLGRARSVLMNRVGKLHRAGVGLAFGSDAPVTPLAGWETVRAAVRHCQPTERMDVAAAFDAATRGGHWAARDDRSGTLTVGTKASFAVWDTPGNDHLGSAGFPPLEDDAPLPLCALTVSQGQVIFDANS